MGYAELIKAVEEEGRKERARILEEAERAAGEILESARKEALKKKEALLDKAHIELKDRESEALNSAKAEARKVVLSTRYEILKEVFREAIERIKSLPDDKYGAIIRALFGELERDWKEVVGEEKPLVYVAPEDARFLEGVEYEVLPADDVKAGVVFESKDRKYRAENTLEARLERLKPELLVALKRILFEESLQ